MQIGAARILGGLRLARQRHTGALREIRHDIEKFHLLILHEEADHGAMRSATEAVIELLVGADRK